MLKRLIRYKVYWSRSAFYESVVKVLVVIAFAYKLWEDDPLGVWLYDHRFVVMPAGVLVYIFFRLFVGYLDKRFVRRRETDEMTETNPRFMIMYGKINKIYKKMFPDDNSADS